VHAHRSEAQELVPIVPEATARRGGPVTDRTLRRTFDFVESVGINTHIDAGRTSYADVNVVASRLKFLHLHYVREDPYEGWIPVDTARFKKLVDAGVKLDLDGGGGDLIDIAGMVKGAETIEKAIPGAISSIEGYNEIDSTQHRVSFGGKITDKDKGDYDAATDSQCAFYKAVHADPVLKGIPVVSFSFAWPQRSPTSKDASNCADFANVHAYSIFGGPPRGSLATQVAGTMQVHGKPIMMTETGYPTIFPGGPTLKNLVDEKVQQSYLLDTLFDNITDEIVRTYLYELMDRRANPLDTTDQAHYGVFRADGTPKPAALAISNLMVIMSDGLPSDENFDLTPMEYSISPEYREPDDKLPNFSTFFEKKPGVYDLVIWSEPKIWEPKTFTLINDRSMNVVTVKFAKAERIIRVYDPTIRSEPIKILNATDQVKVQITDHPFILEIEQ